MPSLDRSPTGVEEGRERGREGGYFYLIEFVVSAVMDLRDYHLLTGY
jgi:hypothetical protein